MGKRSRRQRPQPDPSSHVAYERARQYQQPQQAASHVAEERTHQYQPRNNDLDDKPFYLRITGIIMAIPVLNLIYMALLYCFVKCCDLILYYWRTEKIALAEFLVLPPRNQPVMFHLHIYARRSLVAENQAFIIGMDVASRCSIFCIPTNVCANANTLIPHILKELCQSVIRQNQDVPGTGRPYLITTPDFVIYSALCTNLSGHGTMLQRQADSKIMIRVAGENNPIPLSAITDAHATTVDRNSMQILKGQALLPNVEETYRPSKTQAGLSRSTVKKEHNVPPSIEFCAFCGALYLREQLMECAKCKEAAYCSVECQTKDWKEGPPTGRSYGLTRPHREYCRLLREQS